MRSEKRRLLRTPMGRRVYITASAKLCVEEGFSVEEVADMLDEQPETVEGWVQQYRERGQEAMLVGPRLWRYVRGRRCR